MTSGGSTYSEQTVVTVRDLTPRGPTHVSLRISLFDVKSHVLPAPDLGRGRPAIVKNIPDKFGTSSARKIEITRQFLRNREGREPP